MRQKLALLLGWSLCVCQSNEDTDKIVVAKPPNITEKLVGQCIGKNPTYTANLQLSKAIDSYERYFFQPEAGLESIQLYLDAEQCFIRLDKKKAAAEMKKRATVLAKKINRDFKKSWLQVLVQLRTNSFHLALSELNRTLAYLQNETKHPFTNELIEIVGKVKASIAEDRTTRRE